MNQLDCVVPEPFDFIELFGVEPIEARPDDGYWCYAFTDERGVELRFSVDAIERSVQTVVGLRGEVLSRCAQEGAVRVSLQTGGDRKAIRASFRQGTADGELVVEVTPRISVHWSVLTTRER